MVGQEALFEQVQPAAAGLRFVMVLTRSSPCLLISFEACLLPLWQAHQLVPKFSDLIVGH